MKNTTNWFLLLTILCGIGCFSFFYLAYPYHMQHREQMLLFTFTCEQISSYFQQPAALACLLGDFFTQFFHLKVVGPLLVVLALMKLEVFTYISCHKWINGWMSILIALLVFAWEGLRLCDINYSLSATVALIGGIFLFICTSAFKNRRSFLIATFLGIPIGYYLFGYGMFAFALCSVIELLHRKDKQIQRIRLVISAIAIAVLSAILPGISANHFLLMKKQAYSYPASTWYGKPNFSNERILGLNTEYFHGNWNKINELVYQGTPSNDAAICYNLANAMQGKLPERLMYYYQPAGLALFMPIYDQSTYLTTQLAGEVWFRLGDMTMAEHASILSMIFSPQNKSSRMVKRMAEINLVNGETEAALKYLNILSKTLFYKKWAEERMPGKESIAFKNWLTEKQKYLPKADTLRLSSTDVSRSLHLLLKANPENQMARDYLLCFDLLMKDLPTFITDYNTFYQGKPNRLYAEALMIHLFQKHAKPKEVKATGIHPSVIKDFNQYNLIYNQSQGNASALESRFAHTYWFYYHFANRN